MSSAEINELKEMANKLIIARKLITHEGFYNYWFQKLAAPEHEGKTAAEIFDVVNAEYQDIFKQKTGKYSCYQSFQVVNRRVKNKRL